MNCLNFLFSFVELQEAIVRIITTAALSEATLRIMIRNRSLETLGLSALPNSNPKNIPGASVIVSAN